MPNSIVFIQGSPRKNGNTRAITRAAMEAAKEMGAQVTEIDVINLSFSRPGCIGCLRCEESDTFACALNDEVARTVSTLPEYDVIVLATPIYWWSYPAQLKIFIDRMFCLAKISDPENIQSLLSGKIFALIATAAGPIEGNLEILENQWRTPAEKVGGMFVSCLFPDTPPEAGELIKDPLALKKAKEFGRSLASVRK